MAGKVIVITSGKGGVGKTTTTANLGAGLARLGKRVCLVDADIGLRNLDVVMGLENRIVYDLVEVVEVRPGELTCGVRVGGRGGQGEGLPREDPGGLVIGGGGNGRVVPRLLAKAVVRRSHRLTSAQLLWSGGSHPHWDGLRPPLVRGDLGRGAVAEEGVGAPCFSGARRRGNG